MFFIYTPIFLHTIHIHIHDMALSRIFGTRRDEVTGERRRLHNEGLNDLYCLPNIVRVIKSRRMRWAEHVACMGGDERRTQCFGGERDHLGDPCLEGRIISRRIFRTWDVEVWTGSS